MAKKNCDNCFYWKMVHGEGLRYCAYIFIEGHRRPCPPGDECTVKITTKVKRRKKAEERKNAVLLTYKGETKALVEWAAIFDINQRTLYDRVSKRGWSVERALETPVKLVNCRL